MGYDGKRLGKRRKGILIPIVPKKRVMYEGLGFNGREEKTMNNKIIVVKQKEMEILA